MAPTLRTAATLFAFSLPLVGQNDTVPALLNGVEGGSGTAIPFGTNQPVRVQYVYDKEELPWTGPRIITRVSLRADNTDPGITTFAQKGFVFVTVLLSTTYTRAQDSSSTFEANYGSDAMVVLDNAALVLPAQPAVAGARPANIDFVLTQPFAYGLTPSRPDRPQPENLLVELRIHSQPTGTYRIDNVGSCSSPSTAFGSIGPGCAPAGGQPLLLEPGPALVAGSSFTWTVRNALPNGAAFLMVGLSPTGNLFDVPTLPLPLPLFDAANPLNMNPALAAVVPGLRYGAPDCYLNVQPFSSFFALADASGVAAITMGITAERALVGVTLYAQAAAVTQTANPLQLLTSEGRSTTVCGPLGVARIYVFGSTTATSGQRSLGQGAVLEFH